MAKKTLVIFINIIVDYRFLTLGIIRYRLFETIYDLLQNRIVEYQLLAVHHSLYVCLGQQFSCFENNAIRSCIQHIHPQFFIQYFPRKDQYTNPLITFKNIPADINANRRRTSQSQIQQNQIGKLRFHQRPELAFCHCRADHFCVGYLMTENFFCAFQFQFYVLYNNNFKLLFFHFIYLITFMCLLLYLRGMVK